MSVRGVFCLFYTRSGRDLVRGCVCLALLMSGKIDNQVLSCYGKVNGVGVWVR